VGYRVNSRSYCIATDHFDLIAEQVSMIYTLARNIETLFARWKRHLMVYYFIARR
jgi:hypothetical protein